MHWYRPKVAPNVESPSPDAYRTVISGVAYDAILVGRYKDPHLPNGEMSYRYSNRWANVRRAVGEVSQFGIWPHHSKQ